MWSITKIRWRIRERLRLKTPAHPAGLDTGVAGRADVHRTIAHHHGSLPGGARLGDQSIDSHRVRLLFLEAVAAIDAEEVHPQAQSLDQLDAELNWLIG